MTFWPKSCLKRFFFSVTIRSTVITQITANSINQSARENHVKLLLDRMNATTYQIIKSGEWSFTWEYNRNQVLWNSMYHRILEQQGRKDMWYVGSSVWFDSICEIMTYNEFLVSKMANVTN